MGTSALVDEIVEFEGMQNLWRVSRVTSGFFSFDQLTRAKYIECIKN